MREIKFRAWTGEEMVSPDYLTRDGVAWWSENSVPTRGRDIMQYTGLKDKNGVEIYEGDIVRIVHPFGNRKWQGAVVYDSHMFRGRDFWFPHFDIPNCLFSEGTQYIEVIGNIYENPELCDENQIR